MKERINNLLAFLKEIEKLKLIERKIPVSNMKRLESDAEHSWHLAMFLLLFEKELPPQLNQLKMLKMALIHDLVEIYAGDTFAYDDECKKSQNEREEKAAEKLFAQLPDDLKNEFYELFDEFEKAETKEAKIVKSFDKIQAILQNICTKGESWRGHDVKYSNIDNYKRKHMTHDKKILAIYEKLLNEAKEKGWIK